MASWDEDQEHEIIRYVREHPCFYDTKSPDYKNRDLRSAEWENLAGKFDVTVAVMKAKWKALNDAYNRCMREKNAARSGSGADSQV
ncbi:flocculation protein FLO11-like isoform X2 [Aphelenchoides avenae]|nr:flocculation protein FLO11-like isoform X2 [Aphelenchus avenae]